jgi:tetratricopeptide (TPR) repeat protein
MHSFVHKVERLIWNNQFSEASAALAPYIQKHPRCAMQNASISSAKSSMAASTALREETLKWFSKAGDIAKTIDSESKMKDYIQLSVKLNKQAMEEDLTAIQEGKMPDIYGEKTKSVVEFKDPHIHLPKLTKPLDEWTQSELLQNYSFDLKLATAEINLWKGVTQLQNHSPVKGAYNLRKSYKEFESLLNEIVTQAEKHKKGDTNAILYHMDIHEILLCNLGIFYYLLSVLPPAVTKLLEFIGFKADRDIGIEYLEYVASQRGLRATSAIFMLSINYLFIPRALEDKHSALEAYKPHMDYAMSIYPQGGMMMFTANQYARKTGDYAKGIQVLNEAIDALKGQDTTPNLYLVELAHCYFAVQDYDKAIPLYEQCVAVKEIFEFQAFAGLSLAICYILKDQPDKAYDLLKKLPSLCATKKNADRYVLDKLKVLDLTKNITEKNLMLTLARYEIMYLKRDIAHLSSDAIAGEYAQFETLFNDLSQIKIPDVIASKYVIKGSMLRALERDSESKEAFDEALKQHKSVKYENQWIASAAYEKGEQEFFAGQLQKAEECFKKASSVGKYGFEEVMSSRIKLALKKVQSDIKASK